MTTMNNDAPVPLAPGASLPTVRERNPLSTSRARAFHLVRDDDETGISGTGVVAEGVEFSNGFCAMSWLTAQHSVAVYPNIKALEAIHGHNGRTRVVWVEQEFTCRVDAPVLKELLAVEPLVMPADRTDAIEAAISLEYDDFEYARAQEQFRALTGRAHTYRRRVAQVHPRIEASGERHSHSASDTPKSTGCPGGLAGSSGEVGRGSSSTGGGV